MEDSRIQFTIVQVFSLINHEKTGATAQHPKAFLPFKLKQMKRCILLVASDHISVAYFIV